MAVLITIVQPAGKAGLDDVFGIISEVAVGECLRKGSFVVVGRKVKEGVLDPTPVVRIWCQVEIVTAWD